MTARRLLAISWGMPPLSGPRALIEAMSSGLPCAASQEFGR